MAERMGGTFSHRLRRLIGRRNENKNKIRRDLRRRPTTENTQQLTKNRWRNDGGGREDAQADGNVRGA